MNESTRFGSIKQEILDLKNAVITLISNFKDEIHQKFETMNNRINTMEITGNNPEEISVQ